MSTNQNSNQFMGTYRPPSAFRKILKFLITILILAALVVGGILGYQAWKDANKIPIVFKFEPVVQKDFEITIEATGTLEPENLIDVGAQVSGIIKEFGKDIEGKTVDYSSNVKKGEVLARIDDVLILSDIKRAKAAVEQANASIAVAEADLEDAKVKYELALNDRNRAEKLGPSEALARNAYDSYVAAEKSAKVAILTKEASIKRAKATLTESEATLEREERNLGYTTIVSPVDGVIVDRVVDIGQTVTSGMNTPSLFLIATDLTTLKIWAAVNEADIGLVKPNQKVVFTVDAFPDQSFTGTVDKIRLNASMTSNVVTYIVEIMVPNPDKILIPYLTANTQFIVKTYENALVVPNTALRWVPEPEYVVSGTVPPEGERVWVRNEDNLVYPIPVEIIENNGTYSAIKSDQLKDKMDLVTGVIEGKEDKPKAEEGGTTNNPFAPKMPSRRRR